eukprot:TRINITY_DN35227_c0_g1_i1.p1 TRINITY_DN35227_c0_g1~~TRINITY_DN35227_c0_g1_i1.p1  ORF type:complete len:280 (-),score=85.55 TRINITY_DN35227_c0_g1_i1:878-1717(-)
MSRCELTTGEECWKRTLFSLYKVVPHVVAESEKLPRVPVYQLQAALANSGHSCPSHPLPDIISADLVSNLLSESGALFNFSDGVLMIVNFRRVSNNAQAAASAAGAVVQNNKPTQQSILDGKNPFVHDEKMTTWRWVEDNKSIFIAFAMVIVFVAIVYGVQGKCIDFTSPGALEACTRQLDRNPQNCEARLIRARAFLDRNDTLSAFQDFNVLLDTCQTPKYGQQVAMTMRSISKCMHTGIGRFAHFKEQAPGDFRDQVRNILQKSIKLYGGNDKNMMK